MSAATADAGSPADVIRRIIQAFNKQDVDAGLELIHQDVIDHVAPPGLPPGKEGWRQKWAQMFGIFSDMHATIEHQVIDGDFISNRYTIRGTQTGSFAGLPATGRRFEVLAIDMIRVRDGQIIEHWAVNDVMTMLAQLGADGGTPVG